jgi:histidinol-phosphate aminotransferase
VVDVLNRIRGPFNVSLPAQRAGVAALADLDHQEASRRHNEVWRPWLESRIAELGLRVYPSVANFLLVEFPKEPGRDAVAADHYLQARGLIGRRMEAYDLPQCLRFTVGREAENRALVEALSAFMAERAAA